MKQKLMLVAMCLVMAVAAMAERKTVQLRVPEMECETCKGKVEKVLAYEKGVRDLSFDIKKRVVTITYDDQKTTIEKLQAALLKQLKYDSKVLDGKPSCSSTCTGHGQQGEAQKPAEEKPKSGCASSCSGHNHGAQQTKPAEEKPKSGCSSSCGHKH